MKSSKLLAVLLSVLFSSPACAITIPTVPVGDLGNPNDPATGNLYGGVSTAYNIGTTEVTVGQYTAFLNAVAATDTYSLYNPSMANNLNIAGIARSGASGSYSYSVIGSANHPVTHVSWGDAARFANWLHNGQPAGAEVAGITETGAYTLDGRTPTTISRNAAAVWFIPTENEWYKAAYYHPAAQGGDVDGYWAYPMKTNSVPYSDQPPGATPDNTRVGNFYQDDGLANNYDDGYAVTGSLSDSSTQNYLTDVGAYNSAPSFYGTFDQGGNVAEWNETVVFTASGLFPCYRGGSWFDYEYAMAASDRLPGNPAIELDYLGFRVATVPEPSSAFLLVAAVACFLIGRERCVK